MERFAEFDVERREVRTLEQWRNFAAKWFDRAQWPQKSPEQLQAESTNKQGPFSLGGRTWGYTSWVYDLTPEARYEYFATLRGIGDPLRFPDATRQPHRAEDGWSQECPYCEISTTELREPVCPRCGRELIYQCSAS
jgi:hypothetical protein